YARGRLVQKQILVPPPLNVKADIFTVNCYNRAHFPINKDINMRWDVKGWLALHLLALLLFFSWFFGFWQSLDEGIFWWFNDKLVSIPGFAHFVAVVNQR
ncbi:MAG: hypothetical protein ACTH2P_07395, partial [Oceanisphaera sp.]